MALRFMQIFLPVETELDLSEFLEGRDVLGTWRDCDSERRVLHLLVPADEAEPVMDRFEGRFGGDPVFRVVLFPVEAVLPREEVEKANGDAEETEKETNGVIASGRISREELYNEAVESLGVNRVFLAMTILSSIVAAVGLVRDDMAVIIGAMVIAPLLGPNVAMALAVTLGDLKLLRRSALTNLCGVAVGFAVALVFGLVLPLSMDTEAIEARTQVGITDILLALAAGSAGTFAFTRGMANAVIGVMVAVALMPPLVNLGMLLGSGEFRDAFGALLLVGANVICVNLAGVATFLAQGVRPRSWWEEQRAKRATRIAIVTWLLLLAALSTILFFSGSFSTVTSQ